MHHRVGCWLLIVGLLGLASCGGDAIGDLLDPSKDDSEEEGFRRGVGGGSVIKDLFEGARFQRAVPEIVNVYPSSGADTVSIRSVVVITFSESMDQQLVNQESVTFRESGGSGTALLVDQIWAQNQTVLILAPQTNLQEQTAYEVTISGSLEDLQGQSLVGDAETGEARRSTMRSSMASCASTSCSIARRSPRSSSVHDRSSGLLYEPVRSRPGGLTGMARSAVVSAQRFASASADRNPLSLRSDVAAMPVPPFAQTVTIAPASNEDCIGCTVPRVTTSHSDSSSITRSVASSMPLGSALRKR